MPNKYCQAHQCIKNTLSLHLLEKKRKIKKHGLMQNLKRRSKVKGNINGIYKININQNKLTLGIYIELPGE